MTKEGNSSAHQTVTNGNGYSAEDLAQLKLPGYPVSRKGWYDRARRENWKIREEPGKGPGGVRQIFVPPPEVIALIEARQRGELPPAAVHEQPVKRYEVQAPAAQASAIDSDTLAYVIEAVETALEVRRKTLTAQRKAALIQLIYDYCVDTGRREAGTVDRFLKLVA